MTDLLVVGAGPAGRALAHRAASAGLAVCLIDPDPHRPWAATYGMFSDDAPAWLEPTTIASRSAEVLVYTPGRRTVGRDYLVLSTARFQQSLRLDGVTVIGERAVEVTARHVRTADGTVVSAETVIDARGSGHREPGVPRQRAYGVFSTDGVFSTGGADEVGADETVLMDWRPAVADPNGPPSFSYRIFTDRGVLTQETCLAGIPATAVSELERRHLARSGSDAAGGQVGSETGIESGIEVVDFPMHAGRRPWRSVSGALGFGAGGGLMNPATGYSVAPSLVAVDEIVNAIRTGRDPRRALWTPRARWVYRLRLIGLSVLMSLDAEETTAFFDAFFRAPPAYRKAYLSGRDDLGGLLLAMVAVFGRCPGRLRWRVAIGTVRATATIVGSAGTQ